MVQYSKAIEEITNRAVARIGGRPFDGPTRFVSEIGRMKNAVEAVEAIAVNRDPTITDAAHAKRVADAAKKMERAVEKAHQDQILLLNTFSGKVADEIRTKAGLGDGSHGAEIRAALRAMSKTERHAILNQAMNKGDREMLGPIFSAPAFLSGIDDDLHTQTLDRFHRSVAPDEADELDALNEIYDMSSAAIRTARRAVEEASNPSFIRKIEAEQAAAKSADDALDNAIRGEA